MLTDVKKKYLQILFFLIKYCNKIQQNNETTNKNNASSITIYILYSMS